MATVPACCFIQLVAVRFSAGQITLGQCVTMRWEVKGDVDKATIAANGAALWDGAPLNGKLGLVYRASERLRIETYLDFASRQDRLSPRDEEDPRINPLGTPEWGTINLLVSWRATAWLETGLRLQNLSDRNYREHGSGIDAPGRNLGFWINAQF